MVPVSGAGVLDLEAVHCFVLLALPFDPSGVSRSPGGSCALHSRPLRHCPWQDALCPATSDLDQFILSHIALVTFICIMYLVDIIIIFPLLYFHSDL